MTEHGGTWQNMAEYGGTWKIRWNMTEYGGTQGSHGFTWVSPGVHSGLSCSLWFTWVHSDSLWLTQGLTLVHSGLLQITPIHSGLLRFAQVNPAFHLGSLGFTQVIPGLTQVHSGPSGSLGLTRVHSGWLGLTQAHSGSFQYTQIYLG